MNLLNFFRKKPQIQPEELSRDVAEDDEIRSLLGLLAKQRNDCLILQGRDMYRSTFIDVESENFIIDLMVPLAGNTLLSHGQGIRIHFIHEGSPYQMYCTYNGRRTVDGHDSLGFSIPNRILYVDRREQERKKPTSEEGVRVYFDLGSSSISDVQIVNISATGLAIRSPLTNSMRNGAELDRIEILLPDAEWITCRGVVRRIKGDVLGIELRGLSGHQRDLLQRFVGQILPDSEGE